MVYTVHKDDFIHILGKVYKRDMILEDCKALGIKFRKYVAISVLLIYLDVSCLSH